MRSANWRMVEIARVPLLACPAVGVAATVSIVNVRNAQRMEGADGVLRHDTHSFGPAFLFLATTRACLGGALPDSY